MTGSPITGTYASTGIQYDQIRGRKPCAECGATTSNYLAGRPFLMLCSGVCAVVFLDRERVESGIRPVMPEGEAQS